MSRLKVDKDYYETNGFVIIDDAYSPADLAEFQKALLQVIQSVQDRAAAEHTLTQFAVENPIDAGLLTLRQANPRYIAEVQRIVSRTPEYYRLASNPKILAAFRDLLDLPSERPFYLTNNGILFTLPKEKDTKRMSDIELPWHNEIFHTIPRSHFAQIWAPLLHPATEMIGTLVVCPGSHKSGLKKQVFHKEDLFFYRYTIDPAEIAKYQPTSVSMELGQALIFHHALYHRSGTNLSKQTRISITGSYHDIGSPAFKPLAVEYRYYGETPEAYYYELFHDPDAKELINEQALRHE